MIIKPIEMKQRVAKVAVSSNRYLQARLLLQNVCVVGIILKMEKAEAPSQSPRELPMSLTTLTTVTLGMLLVRMTVG